MAFMRRMLGCDVRVVKALDLDYWECFRTGSNLAKLHCFLIHFFLHFLVLFSSTVFRMHPHCGTVSSLEQIKRELSILVFSQVLFRCASMWFDAQQVVRLSDSRSSISSFFLLQITDENRVFWLDFFYFFIFIVFISCSWTFGYYKLTCLNKMTFFFRIRLSGITTWDGKHFGK